MALIQIRCDSSCPFSGDITNLCFMPILNFCDNSDGILIEYIVFFSLKEEMYILFRTVHKRSDLQLPVFIRGSVYLTMIDWKLETDGSPRHHQTGPPTKRTSAECEPGSLHDSSGNLSSCSFFFRHDFTSLYTHRFYRSPLSLRL